MKKTNAVDNHQKEQKIQILCNYILEKNIKQKFLSKEIDSILKDLNISEIDLLKMMSGSLRITRENVEIILKNSENFQPLEESCLFYKEIIENTFINQNNFLNIVILNHLLTNLQSSNIDKYLIYFNLFINDMDVNSVYQIIITHCFGLPNSIYEISIFLNELINKYQNRQTFLNILNKYNKRYLFNWELRTIGHFLQAKENNKPNLIQKIKKIELKTIKNQKNRNQIFDAILNDDVDEFRNIQIANNIDYDSSILYSNDTSNYWPFGENKKVKLIELSAFSKSIKIFKTLILNHAEIEDNLIDYAIAGGSYEIVHICEQNACEVTLHSIEFSIRYYQNDIFKWLIENNSNLFEENIGDIFHFTCQYSNAQAFLCLIDYGYSFSSIKLDSFHLYSHEWVKYFLTIETIYNNIYDQLSKIKADSNEYYTSISNPIYPIEKFLFSVQVYLQEKGDLNQYKTQQISSAFPNEYIFNLLFKRPFFSDYRAIKSKFSEMYLIFLIKNNFIPITKEIISHASFSIIDFIKRPKYLHMLDNYDHNLVKKNVNAYYFKQGWLKFVNHKKSDLGYFFLTNCLDDNDTTFSIQTTAFCYACYYGDYYTASHFLRRKYVNFNSKEILLQQTPLILATRGGFIDIVKLLINEEKIEVNSFCDGCHQTAFYYACENGYFEIVELLLKSERVDISIPNKEGKTGFLIACEKGFDKIVKILMNENNVFHLNKQAFNFSIKNGHHKIVNIFIEKNKKDLSQLFNEEDQLKLLQNVCLRGNLKIVKLLFSIESLIKLADNIKVKKNLYHLACINGNKQTIDFLKEKGFEIENDDDDDNIIECSTKKKFEYKKNPLIDKSSVSLLSILIKSEKITEIYKPRHKYNEKINLKEIEQLAVNLEDYKFFDEKIIKSSCFSFFATRKKDNEKILVKILTNKNDNVSQITKESLISQKIRHPAIDKFIGLYPITSINSQIFQPIILSLNEYFLPRGTLKTILEYERRGMADKKFTNTKKYIILIGVAHAMKYLHKKGIIYKYLLPENIMLDDNFYPKLSSLRNLNSNIRPFNNSIQMRKKILNNDLKSIYMAPELFKNTKYGPSIDAYSFGMLAYEIVTSKDLSNNIPITSHILGGSKYDYRPQFTDDVPNEMKELISRCWEGDPENRPSFDAIFDFFLTYLSQSNETLVKEDVFDYIETLLKSENE